VKWRQGLIQRILFHPCKHLENFKVEQGTIHRRVSRTLAQRDSASLYGNVSEQISSGSLPDPGVRPTRTGFGCPRNLVSLCKLLQNQFYPPNVQLRCHNLGINSTCLHDILNGSTHEFRQENTFWELVSHSSVRRRTGNDWLENDSLTWDGLDASSKMKTQSGHIIPPVMIYPSEWTPISSCLSSRCSESYNIETNQLYMLNSVPVNVERSRDVSDTLDDGLIVV
jgi:hypothetical protein